MGPAQFGLLALAQVWLGGFRVIGNSGFSGAVIQARNLSDQQLSSVFFLNLGTSLLLVLISSASVWIFPMEEGMEDLPQVVSLLSLTLIVSGFVLIQEALAYRGMRFRFLAQRDLISAIAGGIVGVILALHGWGVWALAMQTLVTSIVSAILLWHDAQWLPKWSEFSIVEVKPLLKFSLWLLAFQLFAYLVKEIDKTIVGFIVGISALGIYTLASKIILLPTIMFSDAINSYLFPKLSSLQGNAENMRRVYVGSVSLTMSIALPLIFAMGVGIYLYGVRALGSQWEGVDQVAPFVAIIAACQSYVSPAGSMLKAIGQVSLLFKWAIFVVSLMLIGALGGAGYGIEGIMTGLVGANIICTFAISLLMRQVIGLKLMLSQLARFYIILGFGLVLAEGTIRFLALLDEQSVVIGSAITLVVAMFYFSAVALLLRNRMRHFVKLS